MEPSRAGSGGGLGTVASLWQGSNRTRRLPISDCNLEQLRGFKECHPAHDIRKTSGIMDQPQRQNPGYVATMNSPIYQGIASLESTFWAIFDAAMMTLVFRVAVSLFWS